MVRVTETRRLCYLCFDMGVTKLAVATYQVEDGTQYDICGTCKKQVEGYDMETYKSGKYVEIEERDY